ncbi:MAG: transporter [Candidatus Margulisiibacteriota bacterium]|jgi:hypothetical protein
MRKILFLLILIILAKPALACRPLLTDDSAPVRNGKIQIESGLISSYQRYIDYDSIILNSIKYGISNSIDFGIDVGYENLQIVDFDPVAGFTDLVFKSKINILTPENNFVGISALIGTKINSADYEKFLGSGSTNYFANLIFTKLFGDHKLHLNVGYALIGDSPDEDFLDMLNYDLAFEYKLVETVCLVGEIVGTTNPHRYLYSQILLANLGANWQLSPTFVLDIGYGVGLNNTSLKNYFTTGVTINL